MKPRLSHLFVYKHRYFLGYAFIAVVILALLYVAWRYIPGGLEQGEMDAAVKSGSLTLNPQNFRPEMAVNFPFYALQRLSFVVFGVSALSIKLPSLLLAVATAIGLLLLLRQWFKKSIAIPTVLIATTSTQFLYMAQSGTPLIMFSALSVWFLLISTYVAWGKSPVFLWKMVLFVIAALMCYVPAGIYLVIALLTTTLFHPRLRLIVKNMSRGKLTLGGLLALVVLSPLVLGLIEQPSLALKLLGLPDAMPNIFQNAVFVFRQWFDFTAPASGLLITPLYSLVINLIIVLGIIRLTHVRHTARSYITWLWLIFLVPMIVLNPEIIDISFILVAMLIARGISLLLVNWWYRLFPLNPYARVAGLIPVIILVLGIVTSSVYRYMYGYNYIPAVRNHFSSDLTLLKRNLPAGNATTVVVTPNEQPFYQLASKYTKRFSVATTIPSTGAVFVNHAAHESVRPKTAPDRILTTSLKDNADRFYIYNSNIK